MPLLLLFGTTHQILAASSQDSPYPREQLDTGQARFVAACGFCHGRDAAGGSRGLDLIRSELVAEDSGGNLIGEVVRSGREGTDMPAFGNAVISNEDLDAIVAFIHNQRLLADSLEGGRRSVLPEDVAVGDAALGERYFAASCNGCHDPGGDLSGIASRLQGLRLMMRMLYPGSEFDGSPPAPPTLTVTDNGQVYTGALAYRDAFTVAMRDAGGNYRSWFVDRVTFTIDDPLQAHVYQLPRYTDTDMHNVLAYLLTLD